MRSFESFLGANLLDLLELFSYTGMSLRRRRLLRFHLVPFFFRLLLCKSHAPEKQNGDTVTRHTTKWSWCWCLVDWYHHTSWHPDFWYSFAIPIIVSHVEYCLAIISSAFERGSFGLLRTRFRSSQNSNLILYVHYFSFIIHYQKRSATRCNPRISDSIGAAMPFASVSGRICSTGASKERKLAFGRSGSDFGGGTCIGCLGCANIWCCSRNCCSWFASKIASDRLET